jgi:peptidoglycan/LPS O-acetylase OafA/YrhL
MQNPVPPVVTRRLRGRYMFAGAVMLLLWGASLIALFHEGSKFNIVASIFATFTFFPLGLIAVWGGFSGNEASMQRARNALFAGGGLLLLTVTIEVLRRIVFPGS